MEQWIFQANIRPHFLLDEATKAEVNRAEANKAQARPRMMLTRPRLPWPRLPRLRVRRHAEMQDIWLETAFGVF